MHRSVGATLRRTLRRTAVASVVMLGGACATIIDADFTRALRPDADDAALLERAPPRVDGAPLPRAPCGDMSGYDPASPWPTAAYCQTRPNSTSANPLVRPRIRWRFDFQTGFDTVNFLGFLGYVALAGDGTVYAPVALQSDAGRVFALLALRSGNEIFRTNLTGRYGSPPAIARDGTVYVHAETALFAFSPTGAVRWAVPLPAAVPVAPLILPNGTVVVLAGPEMVFVDPNGVGKNTYVLRDAMVGATFLTSAAVSAAGTIFALATHAGSQNAWLHAVNASGQDMFSPVELDGAATLSPSFDARERLLVRTTRRMALFTTAGVPAGFTAVETENGVASRSHAALSGEAFWFPYATGAIAGPFTFDTATLEVKRFREREGLYSSIVTVGDGSLVFARTQGDMSRLEGWGPDGSSRWTVDLDPLKVTAPTQHLAVGANGTVYFGAGRTLYAIGD